MEKDNIKCPFCNSDKVRKFVYGLIKFKSEEDEKIFLKEYALGGCKISDDNPMFRCDNCKKDFGFREKKLPSNQEEPLNFKQRK